MNKHVNIIQLMDDCLSEWRNLITLEAKHHNLSFTEWRILVSVAQADKIEQHLLAKQLNIANSNLVAVVTNLENKGFIKKTTKPSDKKIRILQVTAKRSKIAKDILKLNSQINKAWFSKLKEAELNGLEATLLQALDSIQGIRDKFVKK